MSRVRALRQNNARSNRATQEAGSRPLLAEFDRNVAAVRADYPRCGHVAVRTGDVGFLLRAGDEKAVDLCVVDAACPPADVLAGLASEAAREVDRWTDRVRLLP